MAPRWRAALCAAAAAASAHARASTAISDCAIVVAGGSTASLAAALTAANTTTATVCFLEITDWPGGQMTASAVSAIDFGPENKDWHNLPASFRRPMFFTPGIVAPNGGACWVSTRCYQPQLFLALSVFPTLAERPNLRVYLNTAVTGATRDATSGAITSISAVTRTPRAGAGWDVPLSAQLADWYSAADSARFTKAALTFTVAPGAVVIEATEFGDVLATSGVRYAQGIEVPLENSTVYESTCGQGVTIDFYMTYMNETAPPDPWPPGSDEGLPFNMQNSSFARVWTYRRIVALRDGGVEVITQGETSLQNWGGGNDLDNGYLFESLEAARASAAAGAWAGGINLTALARAENRAYGWYYFYKLQANATVRPFLTMNTTLSGTEFGLAKMPYLRDTRRAAAGLGGYRLMYADLSTPNASNKGKTTPRPDDAIALSIYFYADIHKMTAQTCPLPDYLNRTGPAPVLPSYIPFRALTHADSPNLLVAGKSMAMSFWANAGTRLHPMEWATGLAAGAAASLMVANQWSSADMFAHVRDLQALLSSDSARSPLEWTLP